MKSIKGITLISLVITIVVLLILAGVTINGSIQGINDAKDKKYWSELKTVQHAILERDTKYKLTKDTNLLVGSELTNSQLPSSINWILKDDTSGDKEKAYYLLTTGALNTLGLKQEVEDDDYKDEFIVNYFTGEVYNNTTKKDKKDNKDLYITLQTQDSNN